MKIENGDYSIKNGDIMMAGNFASCSLMYLEGTCGEEHPTLYTFLYLHNYFLGEIEEQILSMIYFKECSAKDFTQAK